MAHFMEKQKKTEPPPQKNIKWTKTVTHKLPTNLAHASALQNKTTKKPQPKHKIQKPYQTRNKPMFVKNTTACFVFKPSEQ